MIQHNLPPKVQVYFILNFLIQFCKDLQSIVACLKHGKVHRRLCHGKSTEGSNSIVISPGLTEARSGQHILVSASQQKIPTAANFSYTYHWSNKDQPQLWRKMASVTTNDHQSLPLSLKYAFMDILNLHYQRNLRQVKGATIVQVLSHTQGRLTKPGQMNGPLLMDIKNVWATRKDN